MKIVQLSDIHFGVEDRGALALAGSVIESSEPDALIICGDLTQRGKRSEFAAAREWIDGFSRPTLVVPGNHDTPLLNMVERVTSPFDRFEETFEDMRGPLEVDRWLFNGLNTARGWQARSNWAEGVVDLDQLTHIASKSLYTAVVCHHPFVSPPGTPLKTKTKRGDAADKLMQRAPASLVLSGHVHAPTVEERGDHAGRYLAITAGTLSTRLRQSPPSCNVIEHREGRLTIDGASLSGTVSHRRLGTFSI
ncbi:MAG: metallophosphoesterase [Pseudomonadota bacterium]